MTKILRPDQICFGLSRELDADSLATYLTLLGQPVFASIFAERLEGDEIDEIVTLMSRLMRTHMTEKEYHELFLGTPKEQPQS